MLSRQELEVAVQKTISLYNRLKSPGVVVKTVLVIPDAVTIEFSGQLCYSCGGVQDYVEDFAKDFRVFSPKADLVPGKTRETSPRSFEVNYLVKPR
ncbi:MAG: hypothetical protein ACE14S_01010 [Candidatus Bathyarchaeia archaeon]